jgi:hypothetical protein
MGPTSADIARVPSAAVDQLQFCAVHCVHGRHGRYFLDFFSIHRDFLELLEFTWSLSNSWVLDSQSKSEAKRYSVKKIQLFGLATLLLLTLPALADTPQKESEADPQVQTNASSPMRRQLQDTEVNFIDSPKAYWVHKGFNDTIFGVNTGSFNEARHEERRARDEEVIKKLTHKAPVIEIIYEGKVLDRAVTPLTMQGRKIQLPH